MSPKSQAADKLKISYTLSFPEAQAHYMEVEMEVSGISQSFIDLKMPVWTPGSYLVREYAKSIESLTAWNGGKELSAKKSNKNTWHVITGGAKSVKVKYKLYCFEISVRTNFVNTQHAFLAPAGTFLFPAGMLNAPSTIHIKPYKNWDKVSTSLDMVGNDPFTIQAPNYDILYDSPIEVGTQEVFTFDAAGVKYEVAMCLAPIYDKERIKAGLIKLIDKQTEMFGENPNKRYVFIVHHYLKGSGGLEHLSSTVLSAGRDIYNTDAGYQRFFGLASHEHFHLWNVKRLRPIALGPFDYETENYTTNLWIAEGFTSYFGNLMTYRAGMHTTEAHYTSLAADISSMENTPGTKVQPVSESSFDAWIKQYRPNENGVNSGISYYTKGSVIGMLLDLEIVNDSKGKYRLDDVMKYMYTEYYKTKKRGYTDAEFKLGLEKFAGKKLDDFYNKYIYGIDNIDYNKYLGYAGLQLVDDLAQSNAPTLGLTVTKVNGKANIATILRNSSAWMDGLSANDTITAVNGEPFKDLTAAMAGKQVGDKVTVSVVRDGLNLEVPVKLLRDKKVKYRIVSVGSPTTAQLLVRNAWLKQ